MEETKRYDPSRFDVSCTAEAKQIILTPEDSTTDERWAKETPYLGGLMGRHLDLTFSSSVLDYGCGIGRMAKDLIARHGCSVVGVDTSMNMRALAPTYVLSDRFVACHPEAMMCIAPVHFAIAVWSLQHIPDIETALSNIRLKLRPSGTLFVVNAHNRVVPTEGGEWADDGLDVRELLGARFREVSYGHLDPAHTTPATAQHAYWAVYQRRG